MKVKNTTERKKGFKPITIEITIECEEELNSMKMFSGINVTMSRIAGETNEDINTEVIENFLRTMNNALRNQ